jgi:hypothetical protein
MLIRFGQKESPPETGGLVRQQYRRALRRSGLSSRLEMWGTDLSARDDP